MKLYLVQHGKAMSKDEDPDRPLTEAGSSELERVAAFLERRGIEVDAILHSDKLRAEQTAKIMASKLEPRNGADFRDGLHAKDDVAACRDNLIGSLANDTMIVGHQPFMGKLTGLLTTGSEENLPVDFQKGCVVCVQQSEDAYQVEWMITPAIV